MAPAQVNGAGSRPLLPPPGTLDDAGDIRALASDPGEAVAPAEQPPAAQPPPEPPPAPPQPGMQADAAALVDATQRQDGAVAALDQANDQLAAANAEVARIAALEDGKDKATAAEAASAEHDRALAAQQAAQREVDRVERELANLQAFRPLDTQLRAAQLSGNQEAIDAIQEQIDSRFIPLAGGEAIGMDAMRTQTAASLTDAADVAAEAAAALAANPIAAEVVRLSGEAAAALAADPNDPRAAELTAKVDTLLGADTDAAREAAALVEKMAQMNGWVETIVRTDIEYALGDLATPQDQVQSVVDELLARRPGDANYAGVVNQILAERKTFWEQAGRTHDNLDPLVGLAEEAARTREWEPVTAKVMEQLDTQAGRSSDPQTVQRYLAMLTRYGPQHPHFQQTLRAAEQEFMIDRPRRRADEVARAGDALAMSQKLREVTDGTTTDGLTAALTLALVEADGTLDKITSELHAPDGETSRREQIYINLSAAADSASRNELGTPLVDQLAADLTPFLEKNIETARSAVAGGGGVVLSMAIADRIAQQDVVDVALAHGPESAPFALARVNALLGQIGQGIGDFETDEIRALALRAGANRRDIEEPLKTLRAAELSPEQRVQGLLAIAEKHPEVMQRIAEDDAAMSQASYRLLRILDGAGRYGGRLEALSNYGAIDGSVSRLASAADSDPLIADLMNTGVAAPDGRTFAERLRQQNAAFEYDVLRTQEQFGQAVAQFAANIEAEREARDARGEQPDQTGLAVGFALLGLIPGSFLQSQSKFNQVWTAKVAPLLLEQFIRDVSLIAFATDPNRPLHEKIAFGSGFVLTANVLFNTFAKLLTSKEALGKMLNPWTLPRSETYQKLWKIPTPSILARTSGVALGVLAGALVLHLQDRGMLPQQPFGENGKPTSATTAEWLKYNAQVPLALLGSGIALLLSVSAYRLGGEELLNKNPKLGEFASFSEVRKDPDVTFRKLLREGLPEAAKVAPRIPFFVLVPYLLIQGVFLNHPGESGELAPSDSSADGLPGDVARGMTLGGALGSLTPSGFVDDLITRPGESLVGQKVFKNGALGEIVDGRVISEAEQLPGKVIGQELIAEGEVRIAPVRNGQELMADGRSIGTVREIIEGGRVVAQEIVAGGQVVGTIADGKIREVMGTVATNGEVTSIRNGQVIGKIVEGKVRKVVGTLVGNEIIAEGRVIGELVKGTVKEVVDGKVTFVDGKVKRVEAMLPRELVGTVANELVYSKDGAVIGSVINGKAVMNTKLPSPIISSKDGTVVGAVIDGKVVKDNRLARGIAGLPLTIARIANLVGTVGFVAEETIRIVSDVQEAARHEETTRDGLIGAGVPAETAAILADRSPVSPYMLGVAGRDPVRALQAAGVNMDALMAPELLQPDEFGNIPLREIIEAAHSVELDEQGRTVSSAPLNLVTMNPRLLPDEGRNLNDLEVQEALNIPGELLFPQRFPPHAQEAAPRELLYSSLVPLTDEGLRRWLEVNDFEELLS